MNSKSTHLALILGATLTLAFLSRLGVRLFFGEEYFWRNGYFIYYMLAENIVAGNGFCFETVCAWEPPLYPLFLTMSVLSGKNYLLIVVPQALVGAGTALCAFLIGRQIFHTTVGVLACAMTAFYPYYVMHDTALQETSMVTFCTALAVWLLLRASRRNSKAHWFLAGLALGALPLIRTSTAPAAVAGLIWCAAWSRPGTYGDRLRRSLVVLSAIAIVIGPWLIRTYHLTGVPILNSQTGWALWMGNNPDTFSHYPAESIDRSRDDAWLKLSATDRTALPQLDENARSNWFARRALVYMRDHPLVVLRDAFRKLDAAFSWRLTPLRGPLAQAVYSMAYVPISILGLIGMFLARKRRELILIGMLFLAFACVTMLFWAHTSHRSYLDVYWIVFAASLIERVLTPRKFFPGPIPHRPRADQSFQNDELSLCVDRTSDFLGWPQIGLT
jgi:4-amino-4-deoxy-L-arabinose transferase-like glycosyltransferase